MAAIEKVGVVGAGLMGSEIALVFALAGKDVLLNDVSDENLARALTSLDRTLAKGVQRGFYEDGQKAAALSRIPCRTPEGAQVMLTTSVGLVAVGVPKQSDTLEQSIARADELMYQAKRAGKSRCAAAEAA